MNKTIKSLALGLVIGGVASATYAQGVINFFTFNSSNPLKGQVFLPSSTTAVGTTFYGQLFYSDVSATAAQSPLSAVEAFNSSGVINLGNITDPVDDAGNFIWYSLVVWSASGGSTAAAALGANYPAGAVVPGLGLTSYGDSSTVRVTLGGIDAENDPPFNVPQANGFNNLTLTPVPEPSTIVLGGLGAAALLAFRRRNK
jgi:hypothetical protein